MNFVVPYFNKEISQIRQDIQEKLKDEKIQKKLVLVIVCVALLLDNMLYMVIVPIMPTYLRRIKAYDTLNITVSSTVYPNGTVENITKIVYIGEDEALGYMFAIKAIVQLLVNPFSGTLIDRIGYEMPLIFGLIVLFTSTSIFALGRNYDLLFFARSLQGLGSAFADTSGLSMIADRFTEGKERNKAMGIALAFISFGSLVAPPFGGVLYKYSGFNHSTPFLLLAMICLADGMAVFSVVKPRPELGTGSNIGFVENKKGTPIWRLFMDPYVAICSGALIMANVSLAFLEPTLSVWIDSKMPGVGEDLQGLIWLPAFVPHVAGVYLTVVTINKYPQSPWLVACIGLVLEGVSCFFVPFAPNYIVLIIPLCTICFGIALIDTALLPTLGHLVDTRHIPVYGSVYAIADISYCLAYAFGPMVAGQVMSNLNFFALNFGICLSNLLYAPLLVFLKKVYTYEQFENSDRDFGLQMSESREPVLSVSSYEDAGSMLNNVNNTNYNYYGSTLQNEKPVEKFTKSAKPSYGNLQFEDSDYLLDSD